MDPNATLNAIIEAAVNGDPAGLREYAEDLADWLEGGGFDPTDPRPESGSLEQLLAAFKANTDVLTMADLNEALGAHYRKASGLR